MRRVVVESPFAGEIGRNIAYARAAVRDCILRGEAPIASHLLLTQDGILRDDVPGERFTGIAAGHTWIAVADAVVAYVDFGISKGMRAGYEVARALGKPVIERNLSPAIVEACKAFL